MCLVCPLIKGDHVVRPSHGVDLAGRPLLYKGRFVSVRPPVGGSPFCCYGSLQYRSDRLRCAPTWGPPFQVRPNMGEPVRLRPNIGATAESFQQGTLVSGTLQYRSVRFESSQQGTLIRGAPQYRGDHSETSQQGTLETSQQGTFVSGAPQYRGDR